MIFDERRCSLGEGPLWHPLRQELFWFDINARKLHSKAQTWAFELSVSAAGWVDQNTLLIASEIGLHRFDIAKGMLGDPIAAIEADNPVTRSNDGRADPYGGFWIGTMGFKAEPNAGAIYRFFQGKVRPILQDISIPNAICFAPDGSFMQCTDTVTKKILRIPLDPETGWPAGEPSVWLDLTEANVNPDGAVIDAQGTFWVALWGSSCVNGYAPDGTLVASHKIGGRHATCPAFGGADLGDMYVTTATEGLKGDLADNGKTFVLHGVSTGQKEHQVIL